MSDEVGLDAIALCFSLYVQPGRPVDRDSTGASPNLLLSVAMSLRPLAILTIFPRVLRVGPFLRLEA